MQLNDNNKIISKAESLVKVHGTRDASSLAKALDITIMPRNFTTQKGAYIYIARNPYILLKNDLPEPIRSIVILHEIGHHMLHKDIAKSFKEFNIFDMTGNVMEYEANLFAAQIMLPDPDVIDYMKQGFTVAQIAAAMSSDINLVALKAASLVTQGYELNVPEHKRNFL